MHHFATASKCIWERFENTICDSGKDSISYAGDSILLMNQQLPTHNFCRHSSWSGYEPTHPQYAARLHPANNTHGLVYRHYNHERCE